MLCGFKSRNKENILKKVVVFLDQDFALLCFCRVCLFFAVIIVVGTLCAIYIVTNYSSLIFIDVFFSASVMRER